MAEGNEKEKFGSTIAKALTKNLSLMTKSISPEIYKKFAYQCCRESKYDRAHWLMYGAERSGLLSNRAQAKINMHLEIAEEFYKNGNIEKTLDVLRQISNDKDPRINEFYDTIIKSGLIDLDAYVNFAIRNFMYIDIKIEEFLKIEDKKAKEEAFFQFFEQHGKDYNNGTIIDRVEALLAKEPELKKKIYQHLSESNRIHSHVFLQWAK